MESKQMNITSYEKMGDELFFIPTLNPSSHLQTDRRKRIITFTDNINVTPFYHSLGFGPFRPVVDPFRHLTSPKAGLFTL